MKRFELSKQAQSDLGDIADYTVAQWGLAQAKTYIDALEGRLIELAHRPKLGRRRGELAEGLLSLQFESHIIYYLATDFGMTVARILHKRQDPQRHLPRS